MNNIFRLLLRHWIISLCGVFLLFLMILALLYGAYARQQDARLEAYRAEVRQFLEQKNAWDLAEEAVPESDNAAEIYAQIFHLAPTAYKNLKYPRFELTPLASSFLKAPLPASASSTQQATILAIYHSATLAEIRSLCQQTMQRKHCHFQSKSSSSELLWTQGKVSLHSLMQHLILFSDIAKNQHDWNLAHEYLLAGFQCYVHLQDSGSFFSPDCILPRLRSLCSLTTSQRQKWRERFDTLSPKHTLCKSLRRFLPHTLRPDWPELVHENFYTSAPLPLSIWFSSIMLPVRQDEESRVLSYYVPILSWAEKIDDWTPPQDPLTSISPRWWSRFPAKFGREPNLALQAIAMENQRRQALCALAIGDYQEAHEGSLPKTLSELSNLTPKLTIEAASGSPWNYISNSNGTFTLSATASASTWTSTTANILK